MGGAHPGLDRAEGELDRAAARPHQIRRLVHPDIHRLDQVLVFPAGDAAFLAGRASGFQRAVLAIVLPITAVLQAAFLAGISRV